MDRLTEAGMQQTIIAAAKQFGFLCYHTTYAIGSERGFPDLCLAGNNRVIFLELKGPKPTIYPEQVTWIETLQACGVDARMVFPEDLDGVLADLQAAFEDARDMA